MTAIAFQSRAVRALVSLQDRRMREFLPVWKQAAARKLRLPASDNPNYQSLETLLVHVLRASRGYLTWTVESQSLPDPGIDEPPDAEHVAAQLDAYVERLLQAWATGLTGVQQAQLREKRTAWRSMELYIEGILEHAVVHPERHQLQLQELM